MSSSAEHDVAVFRFLDHWHRMKADGINAGMTRELLWEKNLVSEGLRKFVFDVTTLGGLVETMLKRLNAHSMRVVGDAKMPVKRVVANWGYAGLMPSVIKTAARPDVDVMICGETREWELVEYVQDQIAAGAKKALIVLNHVVSEQKQVLRDILSSGSYLNEARRQNPKISHVSLKPGRQSAENNAVHGFA